jgi:hypothetical protein
VVALALVAAACGGSSIEEVGPPVGEAMLPDLVPEPPSEVQTRVEDGDWHIRFTSVLVNVGEGDFIVRGSRNGDDWEIEQEIPYSDSGGELVPTVATLDWGGDGHDHWHVSRVATYRLVALDHDGKPVVGDVGRTDTKIGFCFYDSLNSLDGMGPDAAVWSRESCGHEDDAALRMGLSTGWGDEYVSALPGQSINIAGLPDGMYRLWAEADEEAWFIEVTRDNNQTWIDLDVFTEADGTRFALIVGTGPEPERAG